MDEIEVTIVNWEKYNPKAFEARNPHWFRLNCALYRSPLTHSLSFEERWVWVTLLCIACERKSSCIKADASWFCWATGVSREVLLSALSKLAVQSTVQYTTQICVVTRQDKTLQNTTEQKDLKKSRAEKLSAPLMPERITHEWFSQIVNWDGYGKIYADVQFLKNEVQKMVLWLEVNRSKAPKSAVGWNRFIAGWLERGWERYRRGIPTKRNDEPDWDYVFGRKEKHEAGSVPNQHSALTTRVEEFVR